MQHTHHFSSTGTDGRARLLEERRRVVEFFKEKGALDSAHAVKVGSIDWASLGVNPQMKGLLTSDLSKFVIQTSPDYYYIDETKLTEVFAKEAEISLNFANIFKGFSKVFIVVFAVFAVIIFFGFIFIISSFFGVFSVFNQL
jgi:hypothetical protein